MDQGLREYYKALCYSGIYSSAHRYGYSGKLAGAMYAIGEIKDAVPVIHGSAGCGFHYRYVCRRDYLPAYHAECTRLEEKDIILGGADKLRATLFEAARKHDPAMIAVVAAAPVDMIHDEIDAVVDSVRDKVSCKIITLKSEKFSHVDKRNRKSVQSQWLRNWDNPGFKDDFSFKGCGFVEAMKALVEQVMERQPVEKNTVNIAGLAWGAGGGAIAGRMAKELKDLGIHVNTYLPNCTTREIIEAPKAGLNILSRRVGWAEKMRDVFGTDYFQIRTFDHYRGLDGIERLYLEIAERLGIKQSVRQRLKEKKLCAGEMLKPLADSFKRFRFALVTSSCKDVPYLIKKYEEDFRIPLAHVCVEMREDRLEPDEVSMEDRAELVSNMHDALAKTGSKAKLHVNGGQKELMEALGEADYIISDSECTAGPAGVPFIRDTGGVMPMDFQGFVKSVQDFAARIGKTPARGGLIIDKFEYLPGYYPLLNDTNMSGSQKMWEKMWLQRRYGA